MSWYKSVTLKCDLCGNYVDTTESEVREARQRERYVVRNGQDVCPECRGEDESDVIDFFKA